MRFGKTRTFAIDVFTPSPPHRAGDLRPLDIWVAGRWLTCHDNQAFVPMWIHDIGRLISRILDQRTFDMPYPGLPPVDQHRRLVNERGQGRNGILDCGETTDNFRAMLFRCGDRMTITAEYSRPRGARPEDVGVVFSAELPERELLLVLHEAMLALWADAQ